MAASTLTLTTLRVRLQNVLVDVSALVWTADVLDESIRHALNDLNRALGVEHLLSGLDGAASTTVDARDDDLLIRGAAGYAARSRCLDRAEMASLAVDLPDTLSAWYKAQLERFDAQLGAVRKRGLDNSAAAPAGVLPWDESEKNW